MKKLRKTVTFFKAWILGAVACQSLIGAMVATGWSYRFSRRRIIGHWQKKAGVSEGYRSPRWTCSEHAFEGSWWQRVKWFFLSMKKNFICGLGHGFTAFLITLLPGLLLAFAWWGGWNNSFNKGYEQSEVGPGLGILGILLMALVLLYLPMAQAHQAAHNRVAAFFSFRQIISIIRKSPWGTLMLGILTALCAFPLLLSSLYLSTAVTTNPDLIEMPPVQIVSFLNSYYFFWALCFVFPAFLTIRLLAARVYAGACWSLAQHGQYHHPLLNDCMVTSPLAYEGKIRKYWSKIWKTAVFAATYAVLIVFSTIPLITQFSAAMPATKRWLMHPMIQMPLHHHIPEPLAKAAKSAYAHEQAGFISWLDMQD